MRYAHAARTAISLSATRTLREQLSAYGLWLMAYGHTTVRVAWPWPLGTLRKWLTADG